MSRRYAPWAREERRTIERMLTQGRPHQEIAQELGVEADVFRHLFEYRYGISATTWALRENPTLLQRRGYGRRCSQLNEEYFDNFLEEPSPAVAYVFGILYGRPTMKNNRFTFASKDETLVDIVRSELESNHKVVQLPDGCCLISVENARHLSQTLSSLELQGTVKDRLFPKVPIPLMPDYLRGIVEANASIWKAYKRSRRIMFSRFGLPFLREMHSILQQEAGVQRATPQKRDFTYNGQDAVSIGRFIYADAAYLEDTGLYVPEIQEKLLGREP